MAELRTSAVMKTDVRESTARFRLLSGIDQQTLLEEHRHFVMMRADTHDGRIIKAEGDGVWLLFPSVTAAANAAIAMQEDLRLAQPSKEDDRIAMRIIITLGDILVEDADIIGESVALAARIESITPPDEIYLSAAAHLALNQAECRSILVDAFALKGFPEPVPVYRLEQTRRTRVITSEFSLFMDVRGFARFVRSQSITTVERTLEALFRLAHRVAAEFGGTVRISGADSYFVTFPDGESAVKAAELLWFQWQEFIGRDGSDCSVNIAVHHGTFYQYRSFLFGPGFEVAADVQAESKSLLEPCEGGVFVTDAVRESLDRSEWETRSIPVPVYPSRQPGLAVYRWRCQAESLLAENPPA